TPSPPPAMASAGARLQAHRAHASAPSPSPTTAGVQLPTAVAKQRDFSWRISCLLLFLASADVAPCASRRQPALVVLLQADPTIPERLWLLARRVGDQRIEMRVPAGSDLEHGFAVRQAA